MSEIIPDGDDTKDRFTAFFLNGGLIATKVDDLSNENGDLPNGDFFDFFPDGDSTEGEWRALSEIILDGDDTEDRFTSFS